MSTIEQLIPQIAEKYHALEDLKKRSPEAAEALRLSGEYQALLEALRQASGETHYVPYPYPVYPYPWSAPVITIGGSSRSTHYDVEIVPYQQSTTAGGL